MTDNNGIKSTARQEELCRLRILLPAFLSMLGLLVIAVTLYLEQICSGKNHQQQVSLQSLRQIRIPARRGLIFTSDYKALTENRSAFELLFYPGEMRKRKRKQSVEHMLECANTISAAAGVKHSLTGKSIIRHLNTRPGLPIHVLRDLSDEKAAKVMEAARGIRGALVQPMDTRSYPEKRLACHLTGYTRPGDPKQAPDRNDFFYYLPDDVGVSGIERLCDGLVKSNNQPGLRGIPGYSLIQVDNLGYARKNLIERIDPVNGNHVITTINSHLQSTAEKLLLYRSGALVAVDASNGDILAAASAPGYDLSMFVPRISRTDYAKLLNDPDRPLFDRALMGVYPPGSILKPLMTLAYLKAGVDPAKRIDCKGYSEIYGIRIRCASHRRGGHGELDMIEALKYSCNVYMIEYAKSLGLYPMQEMLHQAGFGIKPGSGLPESAGIFPSDELKKLRTRTRWNTYDTALLSIGQGLIGITPLQAALYCAALANGGTVWKPNLILRMVDQSGNDIWQRTPQANGRLEITPEHLQTVARGMFEVVNSSDGSGREGRVDGLQVYGKTGSAEYGRKNNFRIYAWFIAYAKINSRTIALAIVAEDGESGGRTCAPIAAEFFSAVKSSEK